jgi:primosomal protein N'
MTHWLAVAVATPAHSGLAEPLTYRADAPLAPGHIVRVPLGAREVLGVVWSQAAEPSPERAAQVRPLAGVFDGLAPLADDWRQLIAFTARYYQRALGEVALAALPPQLRTLSSVQMARRLKRLGEAPPASAADATRNMQRSRLNRRPPWPRSTSNPAPSCCTAPPAAARPRSTCGPPPACWRKSRRRRCWCWCPRST